MINENAKKWVEALRSGRFTQATERLANKDGHCCLGVLCEVAIENGLDVKKEWDDKARGYRYNESYDILPYDVAEWAGIKRDSSFMDSNGSYNQLTKMNDRGKTFNEIADTIESEPEGLFIGENVRPYDN